MLSDEATFEAGRDCRLAAIEVVAHRGGLVVIGAESKFTWHTRLYLHEPAKLTIGRSCLIASDTLFMTSDMHSILDRETGFGSIVSSAIPAHVLCAGRPARLIRENVRWDADLL